MDRQSLLDQLKAAPGRTAPARGFDPTSRKRENMGSRSDALSLHAVFHGFINVKTAKLSLTAAQMSKAIEMIRTRCAADPEFPMRVDDDNFAIVVRSGLSDRKMSNFSKIGWSRPAVEKAIDACPVVIGVNQEFMCGPFEGFSDADRAALPYPGTCVRVFNFYGSITMPKEEASVCPADKEGVNWSNVGTTFLNLGKISPAASASILPPLRPLWSLTAAHLGDTLVPRVCLDHIKSANETRVPFVSMMIPPVAHDPSINSEFLMKYYAAAGKVPVSNCELARPLLVLPASYADCPRSCSIMVRDKTGDCGFDKGLIFPVEWREIAGPKPGPEDARFIIEVTAYTDTVVAAFGISSGFGGARERLWACMYTCNPIPVMVLSGYVQRKRTAESAFGSADVADVSRSSTEPARCGTLSVTAKHLWAFTGPYLLENCAQVSAGLVKEMLSKGSYKMRTPHVDDAARRPLHNPLLRPGHPSGLRLLSEQPSGTVIDDEFLCSGYPAKEMQWRVMWAPLDHEQRVMPITAEQRTAWATEWDDDRVRDFLRRTGPDYEAFPYETILVYFWSVHTKTASRLELTIGEINALARDGALPTPILFNHPSYRDPGFEDNERDPDAPSIEELAKAEHLCAEIPAMGSDEDDDDEPAAPPAEKKRAASPRKKRAPPSPKPTTATPSSSKKAKSKKAKGKKAT